MSVRTRLFVSIGAITTVLLIPSLFAASRLSQLRSIAVDGRSGQASAVASLGRMQATMAQLDRLERSFVATHDPELGAAAVAAVDSLSADFGRLHESAYGPQAEVLAPTVRSVAELATQVDQHMRRGQTREATAALSQMIPVFEQASRSVASVADSIDARAQADFLIAEQMSSAARNGTLLGLAFATLLTFLVTGIAARSVTVPLRRLGRAMARVADGTFDSLELPQDRSDEIGELMRSFETMAGRLAEVDRMKAEFLGMASHELKTPLNVIAAYAELIEEGRLDGTPERHNNLITGLTEQAHHMSRLVSRLMDLSRLEAGAYELAPERIVVEDLLTGIRRMFEQVAQEQGVHLRIDAGATAPDSVVLDVDIIRDEVLGNLISNAFRYTPEGGWVELAVEGEEGGVVFTVSDSGPGIPEEHRESIFKKHYTVDRTRGVGAGLGLAIAKETVELHGGLITLEDTPPGWGARFRVALPLTAMSPDHEHLAPELTTEQRLRVL